MHIKVLLFGIAKDLVGSPDTNINLNKKIPTVHDLKQTLLREYPKVGSISNYMVAINSSYASDDDILCVGDEVAIIPPVSGG